MDTDLVGCLPENLRGKFDFCSTPWRHQFEALVNSLDKPNYALFFEAGAGKTLTSILISRAKMALERKKLRVLVVSPLIVIENWCDEWDKFSRLKAEPLVGTGTKVLDKISLSTADVLVINYDKIIQPNIEKALVKMRPDIVIFDEIHKCKDHKSKRSIAAFRIAKQARYRLGLTGTPILNNPMDLFMQYKILDLGASFGDNFFTFRSKYFVDRNAGMPSQKHFPDWRPRIRALEAITGQVAPFSMHIKKKDCLDLPPMIKKVIHVALTKEQRRIYDELKTDFVSYVGDAEAVVAKVALTKVLRMLQITTGFVGVEDIDTNARKEKVFKVNPKAVALKELLEMLSPSGKVIIWAAFKRNYADIAAVCDKLKLEYVEVHGGIGEREKFESIERFNNDDAVKVFIGHPGSGGIGINLVASPYSVFYSRSFSLEHDIQAEARNYRGGSEIHESVTRYDLVAKDTIDELVMQKLAAKEAIGTKMLKDIAGEL